MEYALPPTPTPPCRRARPLRWWAVAGGLAVALGMAACVAPPPASAPPVGVPNTMPRYIAPVPGQPAARLLLRAAVPPGERYALIRMDDALQCQKPEVVVEGGSTPQPPAPVQLAAGVLTTLDFLVLRSGNNGCGVRLSFTPAAGKTYLVQGAVVGAGCSARLLDATQADRPQLPPDAVLRSGNGQKCVPLAQSRPQAEGSPMQGGQVNGEAVLNPRATTQDLDGLIRP